MAVDGERESRGLAHLPRAAVGAALAGALVLAGCSDGTDGVPIATPSAGDPACAGVLERLPSEVLGQSSTGSGSGGRATWGDPPIVLQCGVTPPGPTTDECLTVDKVDWVLSEDQDGYYFITYGRTPAVLLTVPATIDRTSAPGALAQLSAAIAPLPVDRACVGEDDVTPSASASG